MFAGLILVSGYLFGLSNRREGSGRELSSGATLLALYQTVAPNSRRRCCFNLHGSKVLLRCSSLVK